MSLLKAKNNLKFFHGLCLGFSICDCAATPLSLIYNRISSQVFHAKQSTDGHKKIGFVTYHNHIIL